MTNDETIEFVESSGNIFADLGLPNPEERLAKAELAREIRRIIAERALTQAQAGALLGIAQPNVSDLMRGKLARFSVEKMLAFLTALGRDIRIVVTEADVPEEPGGLTVAVRPRAVQPVRVLHGGEAEGMSARNPERHGGIPGT